MSTTVIEERARAGVETRERRSCAIRRVGRVSYRDGWRRQLDFVEAVKRGESGDQLLFVEHPATITLGRNADGANILASPDVLAERGIAVEETDRGGDVTYHGPGQVVGYPIVDLKYWRRDVGAYLRALEEVLIRALGEFGVAGGRVDGCTGVWVDDAKVAAIGVHLSRWVTSHGFALNVSTNMDDFGLIIPCGITRPVTSMERILGSSPPIETVIESLGRHFCAVFDRDLIAADGNG